MGHDMERGDSVRVDGFLGFGLSVARRPKANA